MSNSLNRVISIEALCILVLLADVVVSQNTVLAQDSNETCITNIIYSIEDLVFSADSKYLVTSWDEDKGSARLWDIETGKAVQTISDPNTPGSRVSSLLGRFAFSSDGKYLLIGHSTTYVVLLWDIAKKQKVYHIQAERYGEEPPKFVVSPDDKYFLLWGENGVGIYDFASGTQLRRFSMLTFFAPTFSKDGQYILIEGAEDPLPTGAILWDVEADKVVHTFGSNIVDWADFVSDGQQVVTIGRKDDNETITLWDTSTYKEINTINVGKLSFGKLSPDGRFFIVENSTNHKTVLWDILEGRELHTFEQSARNMDFTPDSRYLLFAVRDTNPDNSLSHHMWNLDQNIERPGFSVGYKSGTLQISPNGKYLAATQGNRLRLWNIVTDEELTLEC